MNLVLNIDGAFAVIRTAFSPLTCSIEVQDYQKQIQLQVFDSETKQVLRMLKISMCDAVNPSILRSEWQHARSAVARTGVKLTSWSAPIKSTTFCDGISQRQSS
jgi:hypothetical protein